MVFLLSLIPRKWLQLALYEQWRRSLPFDEQVRLDYWGTPGKDGDYHDFSWADDLK